MANLYKLAQTERLPNKQQINSAGSTNQIIYQQSSRIMKLYIPTYLSLNFYTIHGVDHQKMKADIQCQIKLCLNLKQISPNKQLIKHIRNNLYIFSSSQKPILLRTDKEELELDIEEEFEYKQNTNRAKYHYLKFTLNKTFSTGLSSQSDLYWTPFDLIYLTLTINPKILEPYEVQKDQNLKVQSSMTDIDKIYFYLNLMDCPTNKYNTLNYEHDFQFNIYSAASKKFSVQFTNQVSSKRQIQRSKEINQANDDVAKKATDYSQVKQFQFAHFQIALFKNPCSAVTTIFVPLVLLSIINLGIFAQTNSLAGRIQNLAGLMFAYVEIFPIIRNQIPPTRSLTFAEFLIFLITSTNILCLINSILIRGDGEPVEVWSNPFFLASISISIFVSLVCIIALFVHYCYLTQKIYRDRQTNMKNTNFDHKIWSNDQCNKHFMKFFDNHRIKPLPYLEQYSE